MKNNEELQKSVRDAIWIQDQVDEAARITNKAPGIWFVNNELVVDYDYSLLDM